METINIQLLDQILYFLHWPLFPINRNTDKPIITGWPDKASNDSQQIHDWFKQYPKCNWGVVTGVRSGDFVVDIDKREERNGKRSVEILRGKGCEFPPTLTVETPRDGWHLHYKYPKLPANVRIKNNNTGKIAEGIDIKGEHGFSFLPPSVRHGRPYRFLRAPNPENPIADAPQWLLDRLLDDPVKVEASESFAANFGDPPPSPFFSSPPAWGPAPATDHERAYAKKALLQEFAKLAAMSEGEGRNPALNTAAFSMGTMVGSGWIDADTIHQVLLGACYLNGYIRQDGRAAAEATLRSGLNSGMKKPRSPLPKPPTVQIEFHHGIPIVGGQ